MAQAMAQEVPARRGSPSPAGLVPVTQAVPGVPLRLGAPRQERESVVALFLVHMFPIGHLPVATDRPAEQLPLSSPEYAYASGLRFAPYDHPASDLVDDGAAVTNVLAGFHCAPAPAAVAAPAALTDGYDPLGGLHERDWVRRFFAGMRTSAPEFAWPPGELHPEGCRDAGEAVVLPEDTLLDRFGSENGRIFAPDATPFASRSLPPAQLSTGYRRYRVLRELPMWRALSAGWFAQPGGGVRYRAIHSADELVTLNYLADITGGGGL